MDRNDLIDYIVSQEHDIKAFYKGWRRNSLNVSNTGMNHKRKGRIYCMGNVHLGMFTLSSGKMESAMLE